MSSTNLDFSEDDIRDAVSQNAYRKGESYFLEGRVIDLSTKADGAIAAHVHGSERKPYALRIRIKSLTNGHAQIDGDCSCPMGYNCKHVAAVLLQLLRGDNEADGAFIENSPSDAPKGPLLSSAVSSWLATLEKARDADGEEYPPSIRQRLFYILRLSEPPLGGIRMLVVMCLSVRARKDESLSLKTTVFDPTTIRQPFPPAFLRPSDRWILTRLASASLAPFRIDHRDSARILEGEQAAETLERMIATGRCRWASMEGPPVTIGGAKKARIVWRARAEANQFADVALEDGLPAFRFAPAWHADESKGVLGPLDLDCPPTLARALLNAPAISPGEATAVRTEIAKRLPGFDSLFPAEFGTPEPVREKPVPHLVLFTGELPDTENYRRADPTPKFRQAPVARLSFRYGPVLIRADESAKRPIVHEEGKLYAVERKPGLEDAAARRLRDFKLLRVRELVWQAASLQHDFMPISSDRSAWLDFLYRGVPALRAEGWSVDIMDGFPLRLAESEGALEVALHRHSSGIDWFEFEVGVIMDGERVDLVPALVELLASEEDEDESGPERILYLALADGRHLPVPAVRLAPMVETLRGLFRSGALDEADKRFAFSPYAAADIAALEHATKDAGFNWSGGEALREMGCRLRLESGIPAASFPAGFKGTLRPYQAAGLDWLQFLRGCGFGAVLADDMGLGKTVQTLAHLVAEEESGRTDRPSLIVCPTSVVASWRIEAARFAPKLRVMPLHGPDRQTRFGEIASHDVVITTYPLLARDREPLIAQPWHIAVLDEAQMIKNPDALTAQFARQLQARQRVCLTGTPLENHLGELWSLFAFIAPGFLGDARSFNRRFRIPIEKRGDLELRSLLARRVKPFLLRRRKEEVVLDLPPKNEISEPVELGPPQRTVYETIRLAMHRRVREAIASRGLAHSHILVLDALLKLRQACCDPRLLKIETSKTAVKAGSAKLERLMEMLPELLEEGRKILLFSQFT
ncbi:MAG TPA: SNF2-related protein, partial [Micropepsaceae bacterium]|nr:SNF2-related protein [Micropepsaceae bacterium]